MLGTAGASKLVNDISSLADIARAIGDSTKADSLAALRDEFKSSLVALQVQEQEVYKRIKEANDIADVNNVSHNALVKWQDELKAKEDAFAKKEEILKNSDAAIKEAMRQLKEDKDSLQKAKIDWMTNFNQISKEFDNKIAQTKANQDAREAKLQVREDAVSRLEAKVDAVKAVYEDKIGKLQALMATGK